MSRLFYTLDSSGIYRPGVPVTHRDEEYDQSGFDMLFQMQAKHFCYRGRHRFLLAAVDRYTRMQTAPLSAVDLGEESAAGCAIWPIVVPIVFKPLRSRTRLKPH